MENKKGELNDSNVPNKNRIANWDSSSIIAFVAVLISLASVFISFREAQIMKEQQGVLTSQQEASVWPFLYNSPFSDFPADSVGIFHYQVINKGVGPAIVNDVTYIFDSIEITHWGLKDELNKKYPNLEIKHLQNWELSNTVLAPGDAHKVITIQLTKTEKEEREISAILDEISDLYILKYCYCSIFGKCWKVEGYNKISKSDDCEFREDIR